MTRIAIFAVLLLCAFTAGAKPLQRLDALPAFDPLHVSGAYRGQHVCPMCAHGYDAGVLLFLPGTIALDEARIWREVLEPARLGVESPRLRIFIIVTGRSPSADLIDALSTPRPQWHVASLTGDALNKAEADYFADLSTRPRGYVFAQRRIVREFDASVARADDHSLATDARDAMSLLEALYPEVVDGHDQPQGMLWLAPPRLFARIEQPGFAVERVCFDRDHDVALGDALVSLQALDGRTKPQWARTDASACLRLGLPSGGYRAALYPRHGKPTVRAFDLGKPAAREVIVGGSCEGCELVFAGRPPHPPGSARIAPVGEPGEPLQLQGQVRDAAGRPVPGIVIYAYHTDRAGHYPRDALGFHGRLRGWATSDARGRYAFDTIRPGAYPGRALPAHIHLHVIEPGRCTYFIDDVVFSDDPALPKALTGKPARGGTGVVDPRRDGAGWRATRDIVLGQGVDDYARCGGAVASAPAPGA